MDTPSPIARRHFLAECGLSLAGMALASLQKREAPSSTDLTVKPPHYTPKARRVIYLFMAGAPSQLDLFDPKPELTKHEGKPVPPSVVKDQRYAFIRRDARLLGPRFPFSRRGECGAPLSDRLPHLAGVVDDVAFIRSMHTDQFNHAPAQLLLTTGSPLPGRPSLGSWVLYGLGSEVEDLPAFVVLSSGGGTSGGPANWSQGFLPGVYAGVPFRAQGDAVIDLSNPRGVDRTLQGDTVDLIGKLNRHRLATVGDPDIATRIAAYETAFRMQLAAPELVDLKSEPAAVLEAYGATPGKASFANNCLLARRLVERGVRFVQLFHKGWDHHSDVAGGLTRQCRATDRPAAALLHDLKQRGLIDDTLVVWGGEFGRTPMVETSAALGRKDGRDHHPQAFTVWLAGAGIRPGTTLGATDPLGFHITESPVHVHDLQATILHLLGLDHERLTFRVQGRDFRLTDVHGNLVREILA